MNEYSVYWMDKRGEEFEEYFSIDNRIEAVRLYNELVRNARACEYKKVELLRDAIREEWWDSDEYDIEDLYE